MLPAESSNAAKTAPGEHTSQLKIAITAVIIFHIVHQRRT